MVMPHTNAYTLGLSVESHDIFFAVCFLLLLLVVVVDSEL